MNVLFNLQGLWWPAYISLHIDSKFVFVCGLVVFLDSQGISAGFMGFSPWCGHRCQIQARPRWLCRSGHKWIIFYRAWRRLMGLIRSFSVCSLSSRLPPAHPTAPGLAMAFPGQTLLLLRADAAFKVAASPASLAAGTRRDKYPRLCRICLPISI